MFPGVWRTNTQIQIHKYTNTALVKVADKPNMCYIFSVTLKKWCEWVSEWVTLSGLADLTDVTLVSDDTFRRHGTWVTHDHLSSVIESVRPS